MGAGPSALPAGGSCHRRQVIIGKALEIAVQPAFACRQRQRIGRQRKMIEADGLSV